MVAIRAGTAAKGAILSFQHTMRRMKMAKANTDGQPGVVLAYKAPVKPAVAKKRMPVPQRERIAVAR